MSTSQPARKRRRIRHASLESNDIVDLTSSDTISLDDDGSHSLANESNIPKDTTAYTNGDNTDDEVVVAEHEALNFAAGPSRLRSPTFGNVTPPAPNTPPPSPPAPTMNEPLSEFSCPICFSSPTNATLTLCGHVMCADCLFVAVKANLKRAMGNISAREANIPKCPVCRAELVGWDGRGAGVIPLQVKMITPL